MQGPERTNAVDRRSAPAGAARDRSFPLVALLQLATYWAAIVACVNGAELASDIDAASNWPLLAGCLVAAAVVVGGALGFVMGLGQLRMWRNAAAGALVGILFGFTILAVYVAPGPIGQCAGAAAVVVLTTVAFRVRSA